MAVKKDNNFEEDPRDRFRRLLEEAERAEKEATVPIEPDEDETIKKPLDHQVTKPTSAVDITDVDDETKLIDGANFSRESGGESISQSSQVDEETIPPTSGDQPSPPMLGDTPQVPPPAIDSQGMPLPRRVDEIDLDATKVSPIAFSPHLSQDAASREVYKQSHKPVEKDYERPDRYQRRRSKLSGCILRMVILGLFGLVLVVILTGSIMLIQYFSIVGAEDWPDAGELYQRTSQFETTRILDRNGNVLYEVVDPNAGRRTYVPLDEISQYLVAATLISTLIRVLTQWLLFGHSFRT